MTSSPAAAVDVPGANDVPTRELSRPRACGLGLLLVVFVCVAGAPGLDSPWILGDEFIFIARNPDVNPAAAEDGASAPLTALFTKIHDDLYQPLPILSYALQWMLAGGEPGAFRRVDLLLHALNAVLLWWVLARLLRRFGPAGFGGAPLLAWALALLWAVHPMLVTTYASDMGRTHLLSAMFSLVALGWYVRALEAGQGAYFVGVVVAVVLGMLCKPAPAWFVLAFGLEALHGGWRGTLRSPRAWLITLVCVAFGALAFWTSREAGLLEDASKGLFGGPAARSALAVWLYVRNCVAPLWLACWYLPDPHTDWANPRVWSGVLLAGASIYHAATAWRRPASRLVVLGWTWCWGLLVPVIGLVGAREAAAVDRYSYQPLMGIMLVVAALAARVLQIKQPARLARTLVPAVAVVAVGIVLLGRPQARVARSSIQRARCVVELNKGDPRALEALAAAYDFARNHPVSAEDVAEMPAGSNQFQYFNAQMLATLTRAAAAPDLPRFFPGPEDRAPFHRRLSRKFLTGGDGAQALAQAEEARQLQPNAFATWKRLAHAYQALGRLEGAAAAYQRCEELLPDRPDTRLAHYTDYGCLLLFDLERDAEACPKFLAAFQIGRPPVSAKLGLALCEIRYGEGARGFELVREILHADPTNTQAWLIVAEYHLRSHNWTQARAAYETIIREHPTHYTALRGFHEVCLHTDQLADAAQAWAFAAAQNPGRREFQSYGVWALALANDPGAREAAETVLQVTANDRFACLAMTLMDLREGHLKSALQWVARAGDGSPVPKAREFERAVAGLQVLRERQNLPPEAAILQAALYASGHVPGGDVKRAVELLDEFGGSNPDSRHRDVAEEIRRQLSDVPNAP